MFRVAVLNCIGNFSTPGQPRTIGPSAVTTSPVRRQVVGPLRTGEGNNFREISPKAKRRFL